MTKRTFTWTPNNNLMATPKFKTLSAKLGDGYEQSAGDGINARSSSWSLSFTGKQERIAQICQFLDEHAGWRSFYWTEPFGKQVLIKTPDGYSTKDLGADVYTLTVTFKEGF
nr:MAG TPA: minor tail protein [Caudoviricetes sp.]